MMNDRIAARVLIPAVEKIVKELDNIPFRMETWPQQEKALHEARCLLDNLMWIKQQVDTDKARREELRWKEQLLFVLPPKKRRTKRRKEVILK